MADILTQLPVKITNNSNTVAITAADALKVDGSAVTQPISGTVTIAGSGTDTVTAIQSTAANLKVEATGSGTAGTAAAGVITVQGIASMVALKVDGSAVTQPVSGTITAVPTGTQAVSGTVTLSGGSTTVTAIQSTAASLKVEAVGSGSAGTPATGVITVQGISGGTPIPVTDIASTGIVNYQNTDTSIASSSSGTISYTVTGGKTLYLKAVFASSSGGPCKVTVTYGSGPSTAVVGFYSSASPFLAFQFGQPIKVLATEVVSVIIQNSAGSAQDVYATIMGLEV